MRASCRNQRCAVKETASFRLTSACVGVWVHACVRGWLVAVLAGLRACGLSSSWLSQTQSTSVETLYKQCRGELNGAQVGCIMVNHWTLNTKDQMVSDTTYLKG